LICVDGTLGIFSRQQDQGLNSPRTSVAQQVDRAFTTSPSGLVPGHGGVVRPNLAARATKGRYGVEGVVAVAAGIQGVPIQVQRGKLGKLLVEGLVSDDGSFS
jgi:hypothetical protein